MSARRLVVDATDPTPPYEQLRRQLAAMIGSGGLQQGERLPAVRQLAGDLGLAAGTVARTYRELERLGLVVSRVGRGTTVAERPALATDDRDDELTRLTEEFVGRARLLGSDRSEILSAVTRSLDVTPGGDATR